MRAVFAQQGTITFSLERWDEEQVIASSPNFGRTKFKPSAFSLFEFNLDQKRQQTVSDELGDEDEGGLILFE